MLLMLMQETLCCLLHSLVPVVVVAVVPVLATKTINNHSVFAAGSDRRYKKE